MGIIERREREKESRRNMILDAAETLFFEGNGTSVTMDDVAMQAELSKGTLYLYFKNKEDISHGIYFRGMLILKTLFEQALKSDDSGLDKVRAIGQAYFYFASEHSNYFQAMMAFEPREIDFSETTSYGYKCHECAEQVMAVVASAVQLGIEDGSIRPDLDPMKTAYILWGQSAGLIQIIVGKGDHLKEFHNLNPAELISESFDLIAHALKK